MAFTLSPERRSVFEALLPRYPNKKALTIPLLHLCQEQEGWCSPEVIDFVARTLEISSAHVQGVVTFYTSFMQRKVGRHVLWVCRTLSCELMGAKKIQDHLEERLGCDVGETSEDGITLMKAECLAACGGGPMIQLDDEYYEFLTPEKIDKILGELKEKDRKAAGAKSETTPPAVLFSPVSSRKEG